LRLTPGARARFAARAAPTPAPGPRRRRASGPIRSWGRPQARRFRRAAARRRFGAEALGDGVDRLQRADHRLGASEQRALTFARGGAGRDHGEPPVDLGERAAQQRLRRRGVLDHQIERRAVAPRRHHSRRRVARKAQAPPPLRPAQVRLQRRQLKRGVARAEQRLGGDGDGLHRVAGAGVAGGHQRHRRAADDVHLV